MFNISGSLSIILYSLLLSVGCIIIIPLIGALVDFIITGLLRLIFGIIDPSGTIYGVFIFFITFPGVVVHELSHALFALLTGARINRITFYHLHEGSLGSVNFTPRGPWFLQKLQLFLTSCAPVIMGIVVEAGIILFLIYKTPDTGMTVFLIYLLISVLVHMEMSIADLINYASGAVSFFIILFVFWLTVLRLRAG